VIDVVISEALSPLPSSTPLPLVAFVGSSDRPDFVGVTFTLEDAATLFAEYPSISGVYCVDIPRSAFVLCLADAVAFWRGESQ
jgi:hypothetical protein